MTRPAWTALGRRFTVIGGGPGADAALEVLLGGLDPSSAEDEDHRLVLDDSAAGAADGPVPVDPITTLVGEINTAAATGGEGSLLLHAAAVARPDGGCLLLCGPAGSGKSTLTAALVGAGLSYVTDETVCLDPTSLAITAFRKPLSLKVGAQRHLAHLRPSVELPLPVGPGTPWLVAPSRLGPAPQPPARLRPDVIVFLTWETGVATSLRDLGTGDTAFRAGSNSIRLAVVRGGPLTALARLARRVPAVELRHSSSQDAVRAISTVWDEVSR